MIRETMPPSCSVSAHSGRRLVRAAHAGLRVLLAALTLLPLCIAAGAPLENSPSVGVELSSAPGFHDGCVECGCRRTGILEPSSPNRWWFSFGTARKGSEAGWEPMGSSSHCGVGSFEEAAPVFHRTVGVPFLVVEMEADLKQPPSGAPELEVHLRAWNLGGFDSKGQPIYADRKDFRKGSLSTETLLVWPARDFEPRERDAFGADDVVIKVLATPLKPASSTGYGGIALTGDMPGAEILLDGGTVGRILAARPLDIDNIAAGAREIAMRDYSGREKKTTVTVKAGRTVPTALSLLAPSRATQEALLPLGKNPQGQEEFWRPLD